MRFLTIAAMLLLGGCGYHAAGRGPGLPEDVRSASIVFFANRTLEPLVENVVTMAVSERFIRGRVLRIVDRPETADAVLTGAVIAYANDPVAYDQIDTIARWRATMEVSASLRRAGEGEVLWRGTLAWSEEYPASRDKARQEDNEAAAVRAIAERIAQELYFRLAENF